MIPHKLLLGWLFTGLAFTLFGQSWIGSARMKSEGTVVSVKGIALNGPELGDFRYIQDETGAIALHPGTGSVAGLENVQAGDEVQVTGRLDSYQGLLELTPLFSIEVLSSGNPLPEVQTIVPFDFIEQRESELVRVQCSSFEDGGLFEGNHTYTLTHYSGIGFNLYIPDGHPLVGLPIPSAPVELTGILSSANGYRVLVRGPEDMPESPCVYFTSELAPAEISLHSLQLQWQTNQPCTCALRYGTTKDMWNEVSIPAASADHVITIDGLDPATGYYVKALCEANGFELDSPTRIFSTRSTSSGKIDVYFNQSTDPTVSSGSFPQGDSWQEVEAAILERIDQAVSTIDVAVYNANLTTWVDALMAAHNRGVQVRFIYEDEASNSALSGSLPFPILGGNDGALMHNKFLAIDVDDPDKAYVVSGSMNWTSSGLKNDFNNVLIIQDQAMARAYETEFEEMWGGRFGPAKVANTPTVFQIGDIRLENYFMPSDRIVPLLVDRLGTTDKDLEFGLFILTRDELAAALKDAWFAGRDVRGIIEDPDISGSDFNFLLSQGVPLQEHTPYGLFHHKYAIVDAQAPDSAPLVITGSYNWTAAATNENDENTMILHDATIANLFLQEFEERWQELTATTVALPQEEVFSISPNPASGTIFIQLNGAGTGDPIFCLWNANGQLIGEMGPGQWSTDGLEAGLYWLTYQSPDGIVHTQKLVIR
ncbi:MAG: hypothetical protein H6563_10390 [Lewinellaceae bacterium]|nr:hypothetical protein [Lewinellaceae bacterium]